MIRKILTRCAIVLASWLPFFAIWVLFGISYGHDPLSVVVASSLIAVGSAGLRGIGVWYLSKRVPWPLGFSLIFYVLQMCFGVVYGALWTAVVYRIESLRPARVSPGAWSRAALGRELLLGIWYYAVFAGISYAVQTR